MHSHGGGSRSGWKPRHNLRRARLGPQRSRADGMERKPQFLCRAVGRGRRPYRNVCARDGRDHPRQRRDRPEHALSLSCLRFTRKRDSDRKASLWRGVDASGSGTLRASHASARSRRYQRRRPSRRSRRQPLLRGGLSRCCRLRGRLGERRNARSLSIPQPRGGSAASWPGRSCRRERRWLPRRTGRDQTAEWRERFDGLANERSNELSRPLAHVPAEPATHRRDVARASGSALARPDGACSRAGTGAGAGPDGTCSGAGAGA